jgi:hypothetical protein
MGVAASGDYCWLRIRIFGCAGDQRIYPVEAELDDGSWYAGRLELGEEETTELFTLETEVRDYGIRLGQLLFHENVLTAYNKARGRAQEQSEGRLRIQLWISPECTELQALMWERMFVELDGQHVPLSVAELTPFSRYTRLSKAEPKAIKDRPLKLLFAVSNPVNLPAGYAEIKVAAEIESIAGALAEIDDIAVTILPGRTGIASDKLREDLSRFGFKIVEGATTPDAIQTELGAHHILHYLGHGKFQPEKASPGSVDGKTVRTGASYLYLENEDGSLLPAKDEEIVRRLVAFEGKPRLIFLAACESAKRELEDPHPFVGLGPKLVEAGFPAVVAMQEKVPMDLARRLTHFFYHNLLQHGLIDRALNESRLFLQNEQHSDWAIPALFMRTTGGRLFTANPVRLALREVSTAARFQPRWKYSDLPLEAVMLTGRLIKPNWERLTQQAAARVDLWAQSLELLKNEKGLPLFLAISGERGTARSTHLRRLVRYTAEESLKKPDTERILPIYVDLEQRMRQPGASLDFLSLLTDSLRDYWPVELGRSDMQRMLDDDRPRLRVFFDNCEDLPEVQRNQFFNELHGHVHKYFDRHQFVMALGYGANGVQRVPITHLLDVQMLKRRKVEQFLRHDFNQSLEQKGASRDEIRVADQLGEELAKALERAQLFDLAALPWLMARMVEQAESGFFPSSRAAVLQELVGGKIEQIPSERGMQSRALETIYALARELQFSRRSQLPLQEAIPLMAAIRGGREYGLEDLLNHLIRCELMAMSGNEAVRFLYPSLQAYCCAQALLNQLPRENSTSFWEKITGGLGRISQVRWWFDTLTLLCGMLDNPDELLEQIIYGEAFAESERVFLAARCLMESQRAREQRRTQGESETGKLADEVRDALLWLLHNRKSERGQKAGRRVADALEELVRSHLAAGQASANPQPATDAESQESPKSRRREAQQQRQEQMLDALSNLLERIQAVGSSYIADRVMEALIWRSSSVNEPRAFQRRRAVEELGRQRRPEVVPFLVRVAMERTRVGWNKEPEFEYGGIRQTAGRALRRMMPGFEKELELADAELARVINLWAEASAPDASEKQAGENLRQLATLLRKTAADCKAENINEALPAMAAFALGDIPLAASRQILYDTFLDGKVEKSTRWAIADAMALLDPEEVMAQVIAKLIPTREELEDGSFKINKSPFKDWHELLIYLIGQLRNHELRAHLFVERFLTDEEVYFTLKGRAILAIGFLNEQGWKERLEQVALGDFDSIKVTKQWRNKASANGYLRIKALQALAEIGDGDTLRRLRSQHKDWPPEVERVFYVTSEEINWRLNAESVVP